MYNIQPQKSKQIQKQRCNENKKEKRKIVNQRKLYKIKKTNLKRQKTKIPAEELSSFPGWKILVDF